MDKKQLIDIRSTYCELIRRELLGPGSEVSIPDAEHELITSLPYQRYSVGVLYPQDAFPSEDDGKEDDVATEENDTEAVCEAEKRNGQAARPGSHAAHRCHCSGQHQPGQRFHPGL